MLLRYCFFLNFFSEKTKCVTLKMTKNMVFPELKHPKNLNILVSFLVLHSIVENALSDICVREYFPDKNETVTVNRYQDRPAQDSPSPWSLPSKFLYAEWGELFAGNV